MKKIQNKIVAITITILFVLSMTASITIMPSASAHSPPWIEHSFAYVGVEPNPAGVGQLVDVCMWVDNPFPGADLSNNIRRVNYTLTINAPDGKVLTQHWDALTDPTGVQFYQFVPDQIGNYTFVFNYGGQPYSWNSTNTPGLSAANSAYYGDIFLPNNCTQILRVQQTPVPTEINSYPLPTEYWTYPIEGQNIYWYTIASNWLGAPYILGAGLARPGSYQPDGSAPNSAHIMWTKPIQFGGIVGGNNTAVPGENWYSGLSYNPRFPNPLVIQGILYYQEPYGNTGTGGPYNAVDLKTGQLLWSINASATGTSLVPSFGYVYSFENPNQHGVLPNGLLIASTSVSGQGTVWRGYDPRTGVLTPMNVTNVPSGSAVAGPSGEYLKYALTNYGNSTNPNYYLSQWNSSDVFGNIFNLASNYPSGWYSGTENASLPSAYDWNVSVNLGGSPTGWNIGGWGRGNVPLVSVGNIALMIQGTFGGHINANDATVAFDPANITAISLNPATLGKKLWTQSYPQAPGNVSRFLNSWDPTTGVFIFSDKETFANWGYSLSTGQYLWGPVSPPPSDFLQWLYFIQGNQFAVNGYLYVIGAYSGVMYAFNDSTGIIDWSYGNGGEGNTTSSGATTPYGHYPVYLVGIADGKMYIVGDEHSPNNPMYKGSQLICLNASTGEEIWTISGWGNQMNGDTSAIASGYLAFVNAYDEQIYSFGQGPTKLSVTAPQTAIELGKSLVVSGRVTDISAGTTQNEQAARFPNGVPVVSEASMKDWMQYVYMQKPKPTNVTGVLVTLNAVDSNGNYRQIGTTTSDSSGNFGYTWKPDISGQYTVIATFVGSPSYYGSSDTTYFAVDPTTPTAAPTAAPAQSAVDLYFVPAIVGIIIAIIIVGAAILLAVRKHQ